jgi:hypothetical protein
MATTHQKTITLYKFNELDDDAKERARDWYREGMYHDDWWDCVYEDAAAIAKLLGIDLMQRPVRLMNGTTRYNPAIFFSGFSSQGDGACFEGTYSYAKGSVKAVKKHAPQDETLHQIAQDLFDLQAPAFYQLSASVEHTGRYSHERCTTIDVSRWDENVTNEQEEGIAGALRDFMRWIYRRLEAEYEYLNSDETIDDNIQANEYTFDEDGNRAD